MKNLKTIIAGLIIVAGISAQAKTQSRSKDDVAFAGDDAFVIYSTEVSKKIYKNLKIKPVKTKTPVYEGEYMVFNTKKGRNIVCAHIKGFTTKGKLIGKDVRCTATFDLLSGMALDY